MINKRLSYRRGTAR